MKCELLLSIYTKGGWNKLLFHPSNFFYCAWFFRLSDGLSLFIILPLVLVFLMSVICCLFLSFALPFLFLFFLCFSLNAVHCLGCHVHASFCYFFCRLCCFSQSVLMILSYFFGFLHGVPSLITFSSLFFVLFLDLLFYFFFVLDRVWGFGFYCSS